MSHDELMKLRQEVYEYWYNAKTKKEKKHHKKILELIDYCGDMKRSLESISKIGVSHI